MSGRRTELVRKAVHVAMGGFALLLRWLTPGQAMLCAAVALAFNLFLLHRLTRRALLREGERDRGYSLGIALYPAAVLALLVVFRDRLELAAAAWALIAFGDGMAAVAGTTLGGPRLPWNAGKSWAGFVAFVLWGGATSAFVLRFVQHGALDGSTGRAVTWIGASFLDASLPQWDPILLLAGCFVAATFAAVAESLPTGIDDNVLVPLVGGTALVAATFVDPARLAEAWPSVSRDLAIGAGVNLVLAVAAYAARGVGTSGAVVGWLLGTLLYGASGWRGFLMLFTFFVLGTACTKLGYAKKEALGIAQERGGRRSAKHAIANTLAGLVFAFLAMSTGWPEGFALALVAAFATKSSDTVASEIGQAYGRRHFLVTTLERVKAGTDGAVSREGTLAGVVASIVVALVAYATGLIDGVGVGLVAVAAFVGTTFESFLGATFEKVKMLDNELVNFTNTVVGGLVALALAGLAR